MDLKYSFLSDEEPTDEQLQALMEEVAAEARKKKAKADKTFQALIKREMKLVSEQYKNVIN